jgi:hypothetical protein
MARASSLNHGQALIELTFSVILLLATVGVASQLAFKLRSSFKHDFLNLKNEDKVRQKTDELAYQKDILLFDFKNKDKQNEELLAQGWSEKTNPRGMPAKFKFYENQTRELLLIKNLGVITCLKNCN